MENDQKKYDVNDNRINQNASMLRFGYYDEADEIVYVSRKYLGPNSSEFIHQILSITSKMAYVGLLDDALDDAECIVDIMNDDGDILHTIAINVEALELLEDAEIVTNTENYH